jgi:hypothetical protein
VHRTAGLGQRRIFSTTLSKMDAKDLFGSACWRWAELSALFPFRFIKLGLGPTPSLHFQTIPSDAQRTNRSSRRPSAVAKEYVSFHNFSLGQCIFTCLSQDSSSFLYFLFDFLIELMTLCSLADNLIYSIFNFFLGPKCTLFCTKRKHQNAPSYTTTEKNNY